MSAILLIDDEIDILHILNEHLKEQYQVQRAINWQIALSLIIKNTPDLIILDWMLPGTSGIDIIDYLRNHQEYHHIPIILLTAKGEEYDKIKGFKAGADDYLVKPFLLTELSFRIKSLLRRSYANIDNVIKIDNLSLNLNNHKCYIKDKIISLTIKEFKLLKFMIKDPYQIYSREQLITRLWKDNINVTNRAVDVFIFRLRKNLKENNCNLLHTIRRVGYCLAIK